jgi:hypothetical protein
MGGILMPYLGVTGQQGYVVPSQIPNLNLWYNASANQTDLNGVLTNNFQSNPLTDGTEVTKWKDLSGLGQDANVNGAGAATGPAYKTNIQNALSALFYVSTSKNNLDINPIGAWAKLQAGFTIYLVCRTTSLPASNVQIAVTDANLGHQWSGAYWQVGAAGGLATAQSTTISTSAFVQHGMIFDGSFTDANVGVQNAGRLKYRYQKAQQVLTYSANVGTQTSNAASVFYVGGNNRNIPRSYMDGYIGEVLIWTRALNSEEIIQVETYISQKWAI